MQEVIQRLLANREWSSYYINFTREKTDHLLEAWVSPQDWQITIKLDPDIETKLLEVMEHYVNHTPGSRFQNKTDEQNLEDLIYASVDHEIGHWNHCPFDDHYFGDIIAGAKKGLIEEGMGEQQAEQYKLRIGNLFMDTIDNALNVIEGIDPDKYLEGICTHYLKEGILAGQFTESFGIFVDTQMKMFGNDWETHTLSEAFTDDYQNLQPISRRCAEIFTRGVVDTGDMYRRPLDDHEKTLLAKELKRAVDTDRHGNVTSFIWYEKAYEYARLMHGFLPQMDENQVSSPQASQYGSDQQYRDDVDQDSGQRSNGAPDPSGGQGDPSDGEPGDGQQGSGQGDPTDQNPDDSGDVSGSGNGDPFDDDDGTGNESDDEDDPFGQGTGNDPSDDPFDDIDDPSFGSHSMPGGRGQYQPIDPNSRFTQLDDLYRSRAKEITVKYTDPDKDGDSTYEVDWMSRERIEPDEKINPEIVDWGSTIPIPTGGKWDYWFFRNTLPIEDQTDLGGSKGGLPDICFILDSSGSMNWTRDGRSGEYDLALCTIYSVIDYVVKNDKAFYMNFSAINFSGGTNFTGWHDFYNLNKVKEELFNYQGQGTYLEASKLRQVYQNAKDKFIAIMVTDGDISNSDQIVAEVNQMKRQGHEFSLIQVGYESDFSRKMKQAGADVNCITDISDLEKLVLDRTKEVYDY